MKILNNETKIKNYLNTIKNYSDKNYSLEMLKENNKKLIDKKVIENLKNIINLKKDLIDNLTIDFICKNKCVIDLKDKAIDKKRIIELFKQIALENKITTKTEVKKVVIIKEYKNNLIKDLNAIFDFGNEFKKALIEKIKKDTKSTSEVDEIITTNLLKKCCVSGVSYKQTKNEKQKNNDNQYYSQNIVVNLNSVFNTLIGDLLTRYYDYNIPYTNTLEIFDNTYKAIVELDKLQKDYEARQANLQDEDEDE